MQPFRLVANNFHNKISKIINTVPRILSKTNRFKNYLLKVISYSLPRKKEIHKFQVHWI